MKRKGIKEYLARAVINEHVVWLWIGGWEKV